jgi:hypothetical protein
MLYFCFAVEPLPEHPKFYGVQAGYGHVIFRDEPQDAEQQARDYFAQHHWKITTLQDARQIPPERYSVMPSEAQAALRIRPMYVEIAAYETGGGPEVPPPLAL